MLIEIKGCAVKEFTSLKDRSDVALVHQVNCQGKMNSGIAKQIRKAFPEHYEDFKKDYCGERNLGEVVYTELNPNEPHTSAVVGIYGQEFYGYDGRLYTNYAALFNGLLWCQRSFSDAIILPKYLGCDRAGGDWGGVVFPFLKSLSDLDKSKDIFIVEWEGA